MAARVIDFVIEIVILWFCDKEQTYYKLNAIYQKHR